MSGRHLARGGSRSVSATTTAMPTVAERCGNWATTHRKDGKTRRTVKDMCDFCTGLGYLKREHLRLRLSGYKFGCGDCLRAGTWKAKKDGGDGKVMLLTRHAVDHAEG